MPDSRSNREQQPYDDDFYRAQMAGSRASAELILPILLSEIGPITSLIDIGGGLGTWAGVARKLGVETVRVVDGPWVDPQHLQVPVDCFSAVDLESADLSRFGRFDLAICLEAAEHLSSSREGTLVAELCSLADVVFFSAAIPGQGGTEHINERWPSHWQSLFATHGYGLSDPVRPCVWAHPDVEWWYAQNAVLFSKGAPLVHDGLVDLVHPRLWDQTRGTTQYRLASRVTSLTLGLQTSMKRALTRVAGRSAGANT